jgi:hypothetical protein
VQGRPIAYRLRLAHLFSKLIADDSVPPERQANALRISSMWVRKIARFARCASTRRPAS